MDSLTIGLIWVKSLQTRADVSDEGDVRALSIRQPYAELILRGIKTVEYRTRPTRIVGERFWIYASKKWAVGGGQRTGKTGTKAWSTDLSMPGDRLPRWMIELAEQIKMVEDLRSATGTLLPTGVIVGSAVIERVEEVRRAESGGRREDRSSSFLPTPDSALPTYFAWHLTNVERVERERKPTGQPQPVWFKPF